MRRYGLLVRNSSFCLVAACCGCGSFGAGPVPGSEANIVSARKTIESGGVPNPDSITVDGFLAEHVLFTETPPVNGGIFVNVASAWHRDFDALTPQATIQIGFGTNIDPHDFHRGALNLGLVIDRSRSMDELIDSRSGTTKFDAVQIAVDRMLARLTADDLVSIVLFSDRSTTALEGAPGTDIAGIKGALDGIELRGDSNLAGGVSRAFQLVGRNTSAGRLNRVLVFTDAQLYRSGSQGLDDFLSVMRAAAQDNIGTTVFGVGSEFGDDVALEISQIRGGNAVFLADFDTIVNVFENEFDYLVAPVAYDVALTVEVPFEFDVVDVHGLPASEPLGHTLSLNAPTLFLRPRQSGGAVFVRLRAGSLVHFDVSNRIGTVSLNYTSTDNDLVGLGPFAAQLPANLPLDADPGYFQTQSVQRGVLLLNTALTLKAACQDVYRFGFLSLDHASQNTAVARITDFLAYFDLLASDLADRLTPDSRSLSQERALLVKLRSNLGG